MSAENATTGTTTQNECRNCGAQVTARYARVYGDNEGRVHECPECPDSSMGRRMSGAAAGLDVEGRHLTHGDRQ